MENDTAITRVKIPFRYPWADSVQEVEGLKIERIVPGHAKLPELDLLNENTPRPSFPIVRCVTASLTQISEFVMLETTVHIPLV